MLGKAGSNIKQIKEDTGAEIKISSKDDFFPNTEEQVMLVCGDEHQNTEAIEKIIESMVQGCVCSYSKWERICLIFNVSNFLLTFR